MAENALFRKAALDKLASPERLDVLTQVTSPNGWIALWTIGGILLAGITWSIFGSIPTRVDGNGILIRGGTLREIRASGPGDLTALPLKINELVKTGQVIGEIAQADLGERLQAVQGKYQDLSREASAAEAEDRATIAGLQADVQSSNTEARNLELELVKAQEDLAARNQSLAKGLVTKSRVAQAEREVVAMRGRISTLRAQARGAIANIRAVEQRIRSRYQSAETVKLDLDRIKNTGEQAAQLRSPVDGRVVEIKKRPGDAVAPGEVIAIVEPEAAETEPVVYVNSTTGRQIARGMEAQVSPSTVKREEFGFMKATISYVGEYPVTPQAVQSVVANQSLAQELIGSSAKIEVRAKLTPNDNTASGYAWSSSAGPGFKIQSGTRVVISVVVDRRAPISFVLPTLRRALGSS